MADNVNINDATLNIKAIATDDVGSVQFQKVKIDVGSDGVSTPLSSSNPMPVSVNGVSTEATLASFGFTSVTTLSWTGLTSGPSTGQTIPTPSRFFTATNPYTLRFTGTWGGATVWLESKDPADSEWVSHATDTSCTSSSSGMVYLSCGHIVRINMSGATGTTSINARIS